MRDKVTTIMIQHQNAYLAKDPVYIILQKEGGHMSSNKRDITKIIRLNGREYQMVMEKL